MDEATSALDNDTEAAIMESINSLHGHKTLIIIAHRLQTIEKCDIVYRVDHGDIERKKRCATYTDDAEAKRSPGETIYAAGVQHCALLEHTARPERRRHGKARTSGKF